MPPLFKFLYWGVRGSYSENLFQRVFFTGHSRLLRHVDIAADGLDGLKLGSGGIGYTYKPLGAAAWAFLHAEAR